MSSYVTAELRRRVAARAGQACEYCRIQESDTWLGCHVDHVISEKHGGATAAENLAFACASCNRAKGSDIGSIAPGGGEFTRFFNPRVDRCADHFRLDGVRIESLSTIREATARIPGFNTTERLFERQVLIEAGRYAIH